MNCKNCGMEINHNNAMHCAYCGNDYCEACADSLSMCDCYSNFSRYQ